MWYTIDGFAGPCGHHVSLLILPTTLLTMDLVPSPLESDAVVSSGTILWASIIFKCLIEPCQLPIAPAHDNRPLTS